MELASLPFEVNSLDPEKFSNHFTQKLYEFLPHHIYAKYQDSWISVDERFEVLQLELEIEIPQKPRNDIRRIEPIAIVASISLPQSHPAVFALRDDFPKVSHLNLYEKEIPRQLCLYEGNQEDIALKWNPYRFIERIRNWFSLTARGELHQDDQPLEPFFLDLNGFLILPNDLDEKSKFAEHYYPAYYYIPKNAAYNFYVIKIESENYFLRKGNSPELIVLPFTIKERQHGVIQRAPINLKDLSELVESDGFDLIDELRKSLNQIFKMKKLEYISDSKVVILINVPLSRASGKEIEKIEKYAFVTDANLINFGIVLDVWNLAPETQSFGIIFAKKNKELIESEKIKTIILNTVHYMTREEANVLNGIPTIPEKQLILIGVGALGSHFLVNLVRSGIGRWAVFDHDLLLPHNLTRHALPGPYVGFPKALAMADYLKSILDKNYVTSYVENFLKPIEKDEEFRQLFSQADYIIDISTTISVERKISLDLESDGRRVSIFISPSGMDSVFLGEDSDRATSLDVIEMQYYRYIIKNRDLHHHLKINGVGVKYGTSCRDFTSRISQDNIALHAAIMSKAFEKFIRSNHAACGIWTAINENMELKHYSVDVSRMVEYNAGGWIIKTDEEFIKNLHHYRTQKLPNETGGVLIGSHDITRKIIYIIDLIPSPEDSDEWPNEYIRGLKGLSARVGIIQETTADNLTYVGEWHSHPKYVSTSASDLDYISFDWLRMHMHEVGLPAVMAIVGDSDEVNFIVD